MKRERKEGKRKGWEKEREREEGRGEGGEERRGGDGRGGEVWSCLHYLPERRQETEDVSVPLNTPCMCVRVPHLDVPNSSLFIPFYFVPAFGYMYSE